MTPQTTPEELGERLSAIPVVKIAQCDTPLCHLARLSDDIGGPQVFAKRDDLTDLALGGNKARNLEYVMGDVLRTGADVVVVSAFAQSNLCRQTAAAARKLGLRAVLVLKGQPGSGARGNLTLDVLLGAEIHFIDTEDLDTVRTYITRVMQELRLSGAKPYFIDDHGETGHFSSFSYLGCFLEIQRQSRAMGFEPTAIFLASASGGTQSGLDLGRALLGSPTRVIGVNPMSWGADYIRQRVVDNASRASQKLGYSQPLGPEEIRVLDEYKGPGYGVPTDLSREAQTLFALDEAIILDPTYTAKAAGAMIDWIRKDRFEKNEAVVFIHTGGVPIVFANDLPYDENRIRVVSREESEALMKSSS